MGAYQDFGLVIDATATSADGKAMEMRNDAGFSIQTEYTTVTGTFKLQSRNNEALSWRDVTQVVFTQPAGSGGGEVIEVGNARSRFYRVVYTHGSGSGTIKVAVHAKGGF